MKNLKKLTVLSLALVLSTTGMVANAEAEEYESVIEKSGEPSVIAEETIGNFNDLNNLISKTENGQTITLDKDYVTTTNQYVPISKKSIVLDLNGHTIESKADIVIKIHNSGKPDVIDVTIKNGTIRSTEEKGMAINVINNCNLILENVKVIGNKFGLQAGSNSKYLPNVTIKGENTVIDGNEAGVSIFGLSDKYITEDKIVLNVIEGKITGGYFGIAGNGIDTQNHSEITISGGEVIATGTDSVGIYHPQNGDLTVTGGTIIGSTGIEMRAGTLTVSNDATIEGNGVFSINSNPSGSTTQGVGIAISQHTTKKDISVSITGGNIKGDYALYEDAPETEESVENVEITIAGGDFVGTTKSVYSDNVDDFISAGTFTDLDILEYVQEAAAGVTVELQSDVELSESLTLEKPLTLDLNGNKIIGNFATKYEDERDNLINVTSNNITIKNGELVATDNNKNVLSVYESDYITLNGIKLTHEGYDGVPLNIENSNVEIAGNFTLETNENSKYAISVSGSKDDSSLTFDNEVIVKYDGQKELVNIEEIDTENKPTIIPGGNIEINSETGKVTVKEEPTPAPDPDPMYPSYRPSTSLSNVTAETVDGDKVKAKEVKTDKDLEKTIYAKDSIVTTIEVGKANNDVIITYKAGRNYKNEIMYIVASNEDGKLVWLDTVKADNNGTVELKTEGNKEITLVSVIKGWIQDEKGVYYFFDYETGVQQMNRWLAEYTDWYFLNEEGKMVVSSWIARDSKLDVWYYVDANGLFVTGPTTIDGYFIDAHGIWRA